MGLKKENYTVEKIGITLPEAYAIIDKIRNEKDSVKVTFGIYGSREAQKNFQPIETKDVFFTWDRKMDIAVQAYNIAKGQTLSERPNEYTGEPEYYTIDGVFYGWTDDIVW